MSECFATCSWNLGVVTFFVGSGHISPVLIGCKQAGIRVIDTRHEATAVFAADAVRSDGGICVSDVLMSEIGF
jgi:thiamine pyrophosphate-dependent acetolactate synthase large subunit-like protein